MATTAASGTDSFLQNERQAISALEADPNATSSYKQGLEQEFAAVVAQFKRQTTPQDAVPPANDQSIAPVAVASKAAPPTVPNRAASSLSVSTAEPDASTPPSNAGGDGTPNLDGQLPAALAQWMPDIETASKATGEPADLLAAQVWDESRGQTGASSTNGGTGLSDAGLTQQDPATFQAEQQKHPELQGKSSDDPLANLEAAGFEMSEMDHKFGSWQLAARAYNSGEGSVDPNDPNVTTTGLGDPNYITKVFAEKQDIDNGTPLPA